MSSVHASSLSQFIYADFRHWSLHSHHSLLTASCTNTTTVAQEHWKVSSTTVCHISTFLTFLLAQGRWLRPSCRSTMALYSVGMLCLLCLILSSFMVWNLTYFVPVSEPGNREDCGRNVIWHKNTFGCMAWLTLALICVAAAGLLVVIQWEAWVRGDQWLTKDLIKSRIRWV